MDYASAVEKLDDLLDLISDIESNYKSIWNRAEDFLLSVRDSASNMKEKFEAEMDGDENVCFSFATEAQAIAIENWTAGVCKWHPDMR